jgi:hypothetical protein
MTPDDPKHAPPYAVPPVDRAEVARFLREQPPLDVPRRQIDRPVPGLVAAGLLGGRIVRRFE